MSETKPTICTRLSCLDTGPITGAIEAVAHGHGPRVLADLMAAHEEMKRLAQELDVIVPKIVKGRLTAIEALAMLGEIPSTAPHQTSHPFPVTYSSGGGIPRPRMISNPPTHRTPSPLPSYLSEDYDD